MHNPFVLLSDSLLDSLIQSGYTFFVRQTYTRGKNLLDPSQKGAFLFTHYKDYSRAKTHFDALVNDANRFLYTNTEATHHEKLVTAASQPEGFRIYSPLLKHSWKPTPVIATRIRQYIDQKISWTPTRADKLRADLFVQFGELFITLKYGVHALQVPLAEIENF